MNHRTLLSPSYALAVFLLIGHNVMATDPEARALVDKFLAHMSANGPVAGTFRIETIPDPAMQEAFRKKARENAGKDGYGVSFGPDKPELHCRWAWDGSREILETLPGSNVLKTFMRTPEAHLQQTEKLNFNLDKPGPASVWRPASFYFLWSVQPWSDVLKDCEFRLEAAPAGVPAGCVVVEAKDRHRTIHLVVNRKRGIYHGHRTWLADGNLLADLSVEKLQESRDGRVFPLSAQARLFQPGTGKVDTTFVLSAREVSFPASGNEFEKSFTLSLPEGTVINDLLLSKQIKLKKATSATDILAGKLPGEPVQFKTTTPPTRTQTVGDSGSWFWPGFAFLMSIPLAIYLAYRGYTIWRMHGGAK